MYCVHEVPVERPDLELGKVVSHHGFWELNPVLLEEQQVLSVNCSAFSPAPDKLISKEKNIEFLWEIEAMVIRMVN